ncbi:MAG: hypothetical protein QM784_17630 [Polyangiaceae bacterium]
MAELNLLNPSEMVDRSSTLPSPPPKSSPPAALGLNELNAWFQEPEGDPSDSEAQPSTGTDGEPPLPTPTPTSMLLGLERLTQRRPYVVACGAALGSAVRFLFVVGAAQLLTVRPERSSMVMESCCGQRPMSVTLEGHPVQADVQARQ